MNIDQNSTPKKSKGGCLKWVALLFGLAFLFTVVSVWRVTKTLESDNKKIEQTKKDSIVRNQKFQNGWKSLDIKDKKEEINKLINSNEKFYSEKRFLINENILTLIKVGVKYPETLEYKSISKDFVKNPNGYTTVSPEDFSNINYDNGSFTVSKEFKSENKLGMKVRGIIFCDFTFNGLKYTIKDIKFE
ncbi:hypothetical protein [Chryseobacterium viscerum]|uniref:Lipoprotein n=1 Tax=Chryseobacterium viscerum TaxID=1037377 RepID=A0A5N4BT26_9FLAO|nr:hypothetical protein [Chryseobacterium viscerum]KAB1231552.1 hypothetical protein F8D52_07020 [Chryseobacterium viscerum]